MMSGVRNGMDSSLLFRAVNQCKPDLGVVRGCVEAGVNILDTGRYGSRPILHSCISEHQVDVLRVLLDSRNDVDFTLRSWSGQCALHCIFRSGQEGSYSEDVKEIAGIIVDRVTTHPRDRIDWGQQDADGLDFLSLAAREGVLSDLYPVVKDQPYYAKAAKPLELGYMPREDDWARMRQEVHASLCTSEVGYTRRLCDEVEKERSNADLIRCCVDLGADILAIAPNSVTPTLHYCILKGDMGMVQRLLATKREIDFTRKRVAAHTPIHCICSHFCGSSPHTPEEMKAMTAAIVRRLDTHSEDTVDLGAVDDAGRDFLSLAAREGVLSDLYPLVRDQPYYKEAAKPLQLAYRPLHDDWARVSEEDQKVFQCATIGDDATRRLYDEMQTDAPRLDVVALCATGGADASYKPKGDDRSGGHSALHYCVLNSHVEALEVLLEKSEAMDFMATGEEGWSTLHYVIMCAESSLIRKQMITSILGHLLNHPADRVDWGLRDQDGLDFLSLAAREGVLADLYPLVKDQPYYVHAEKPIILNCKPPDSDWLKMTATERSLFVVENGRSLTGASSA